MVTMGWQCQGRGTAGKVSKPCIRSFVTSKNLILKFYSVAKLVQYIQPVGSLFAYAPNLLSSRLPSQSFLTGHASCDVDCHTSAAIWLANDIFWQSTVTQTWCQHFWCDANTNKKLHIASKFSAPHFLMRDVKMIKWESSLACHDEWGWRCALWPSATTFFQYKRGVLEGVPKWAHK